MRYFWKILKEEYIDIFTDPGMIMILLAGLLIYTMIYPIPYYYEVLKEVDVAVIDNDHTALSRKLIRWIQATEEVNITEQLRNFHEAKQLLYEGKIHGILVIPDEFERKILTRQQAVIQLFADASYFLVYRQIYTGVYKATATLSAGVEIRRMSAEGFSEPYARTRWNFVNTDVRALFNPAGGYATYVVPGVLMLILQQTLLIGIGMLFGTRYEQMEPLPVTARRQKPAYVLIICARGLAYFSIYILFPLFYLFVIYRIYDLPKLGFIADTLIFLVPYVLSIILFGFTLCIIFITRETSIPALIFTSLPAVLLIGFAWPLETIPRWLRWLSLLLPSTSGSAGFVRINHMGASLYEVRWEWFTLWSLCVLYFFTAWLSLRIYHLRTLRKKTTST